MAVVAAVVTAEGSLPDTFSPYTKKEDIAETKDEPNKATKLPDSHLNFTPVHSHTGGIRETDGRLCPPRP